MNKIVFIAIVFFFLGASAYEGAFSTNMRIVELDGSVGKVSWNYDAKVNAELMVYHRGDKVATTELKLYDMGMQFVTVEGTCYALLISGYLPSASVRMTEISKDKSTIQYEDIVEGDVDPTIFEIPESCKSKEVTDGIFCPTCQSVSQSVVSLGCNVSSTEIANLCGKVFATVCKSVLEEACSGACLIKECADIVCCDVGLCSGSVCSNSTNTTSSSSLSSITSASSGYTVSSGPSDDTSTGANTGASTGASSSSSSIYPTEEKEGGKKNVEGGIFCPSCLSVATAVINLGCNATSTEISDLCGNVFAGLCKQVLETFCSGGCSIEECGPRSCCLLDLCNGNSCNATLSSLSPSLF